MVERRSLVEGLKPPAADTIAAEKEFIYGSSKPAPAPIEPKTLPPVEVRVPLTTRVRPDLAAALKRVSLERQLAGQTPSAVQDIVDAALEHWLTDQGLLAGGA